MPRRTHQMPFMLSFGARMRSLRQEQGLSLAQLAKKTGIGKGHLSTIEHGFAAITTQTIERIAAGLDLLPFMLLAFPDEDKLAAIVDLIRHVPTTRHKRLRRILEKLAAESGQGKTPG